jgi:hypothetical protein
MTPGHGDAAGRSVGCRRPLVGNELTVGFEVNLDDLGYNVHSTPVRGSTSLLS